MYYPYFRGKQFELILLRDRAAFIADNSIHPIIEPVKDNLSSLKKVIEQFVEFNVTFTIILNPQCGDMVGDSTLIEEIVTAKNLRDYEDVTCGYIINSESKMDELTKVIKDYGKYSFSLVHYGYADGKTMSKEMKKLDNIKEHIFIDGYAGRLYRRHFDDNTKKILIRDGFKAQKNAEYPATEHFSDLHITYTDEKLDGFGDFSIVGDEYRESGGPAYAVAIHLTYLDDDDDMHVRHFISDRVESPIDPAGKFLEALTKLVKEVKKENTLIYRSDACNEYIELYKASHFPGLGYVKKLSMQHHLELIANFLSER
jgi:hypothetical protein